VFSILKNDFVCGYRDIEKEKWAGASGNHMPDGQAVDTTNGAGPHNVQIFVLAADGTVLTCLPGYWGPEDLASELKLAQNLNRVWQNPKLSVARKFELFQQMQIAHIAEHSENEHQRSQMQGFDASFEASRRFKNQDVFANGCSHRSMPWSNVGQNLKSTDVIMHERMARQPFVPYENFNVQAFSDYGLTMYDKNEDALVTDGHRRRGGWRRGTIGNHHPFADGLSSLAGL
jgi:hypothetical protein